MVALFFHIFVWLVLRPRKVMTLCLFFQPTLVQSKISITTTARITTKFAMVMTIVMAHKGPSQGRGCGCIMNIGAMSCFKMIHEMIDNIVNWSQLCYR